MLNDVLNWITRQCTKIHAVPASVFNGIPEGEPVASILPLEGYGNHSCQDCRIQHNCPITNYVAADYGGVDKPNRCSFYWPPNTPDDWHLDDWYWGELYRIKREREGVGEYGPEWDSNHTASAL